MNPFVEGNLYGAICNLGVDNKHNRSIRECLLKTICHVEDVIPGKNVFDFMPTAADVEEILQPSEPLTKGITIIRILNPCKRG